MLPGLSQSETRAAEACLISPVKFCSNSSRTQVNTTKMRTKTQEPPFNLTDRAFALINKQNFNKLKKVLKWGFRCSKDFDFAHSSLLLTLPCRIIQIFCQGKLTQNTKYNGTKGVLDCISSQSLETMLEMLSPVKVRWTQFISSVPLQAYCIILGLRQAFHCRIWTMVNFPILSTYQNITFRCSA